MLETLFQVLFKYRPAIFAQGDFRLGASSNIYVAVAMVLAVAAATLLTYRSVGHNSRVSKLAMLVGLRLAALAIVAFCLFRPVLVLKVAVPQQNFLGILIDDTRSMRIADRIGEPRSALITQEFGNEGPSVFSALSERFAIRFFRFSSSATRLASVGDLSFGGTQTRLGSALESVRNELAGLPVAALIAISDGADNSQSSIAETLLALKADAIPVFTVGVGQETLSRDIQVGRVSAPRSVLKGTALAVDAIVTHAGYTGSTVPLNVESEGRILGTEQVKLPRDGEPATVRVRFTASEPGVHVFRFRVPLQPGEMVTQNNVRDVLIDIQDRHDRILYFEGEPRFEVKFLRRAVDDDKNLRVVVLQRTAENKYLILNVDNTEEFASGFPKTREELFAYRGLVLGSVEAGAFTGDQLQMIADFVDRRGGGLLMLGGARSLSEGGYAETPVGQVSPIVLDIQSSADQNWQNASLKRLSVRPTRAGAGHPATQIAKTEQESLERWNELPPVTSVNSIRGVKPGATILLNGTDMAKREQPVLVYQRYGRGKAVALPIQDTWVWQMHASIQVADMTHETFWRQMLRWLVDGVPDIVSVTTATEMVEPGETVELVSEVVDSTWVEVNNGRVTAGVIAPSGKKFDVPMTWTTERNGEYKASFVPEEEGVYEARVSATRDGTDLGTGVAHVRAGPSDSEYFDAAMRAPLLQRIADETGGRFYTEKNMAALTEDVKYTGRGVTVVEERDLWDMPVLLLALVGLVLAEWSYRRRIGLA